VARAAASRVTEVGPAWPSRASSPAGALAIHRHAPSLAQPRERTLRATLRPAAPSSSSCAFLPQPLVRHPTHSDSLVGAPASYLVNSRIFDQLKASVGVLSATSRVRSADHFPLAHLVGQTIADLQFHREDPALISQRGGSAIGELFAGARGASLRPLAPPDPQRHATAGFASPGFVPPHARHAPCIGLPLAASHSRRDAPGCCRSGPCDTTGTCRSGHRDQVRRPLVGGTFVCNERSRRLGGPDSR